MWGFVWRSAVNVVICGKAMCWLVWSDFVGLFGKVCCDDMVVFVILWSVSVHTVYMMGSVEQEIQEKQAKKKILKLCEANSFFHCHHNVCPSVVWTLKVLMLPTGSNTWSIARLTPWLFLVGALPSLSIRQCIWSNWSWVAFDFVQVSQVRNGRALVGFFWTSRWPEGFSGTRHKWEPWALTGYKMMLNVRARLRCFLPIAVVCHTG